MQKRRSWEPWPGKNLSMGRSFSYIVAGIVMSDHPSTCRMCGGARHQSLGTIPAGDFFAGRVQPTAIPGGQLWRCLDCDSLFRHPVLTGAEYRRLYEGGAAEQWSGDETRLDLAVVRSVVLGSAGKRVLDVGCGGG